MESKTTSSDNISTDIPLVRDASSPPSAASSQPPLTPRKTLQKTPEKNSKRRGTKLEDEVCIHPEGTPPSYDSICTKQPKSSDAKAFEPTAPPDLRQAAHIDGLGCSNMNQSVPPATTGRNDKGYWCDCDCDADSIICCL
ncbi:hypothetical protein NQ317_001717, partial [Molorchus minor]